MRVFALLMFAVAAPAFAADQFDLACQGTRMTARAGPSTPYAFKMHVDLAARKWCMDACARTVDVVRVEGDKVVFQDDLIVNTREETTRDTSLDRKSGALHQTLISARPEESYQKVDATCTTQAFTPFPRGRRLTGPRRALSSPWRARPRRCDPAWSPCRDDPGSWAWCRRRNS